MQVYWTSVRGCLRALRASPGQDLDRTEELPSELLLTARFPCKQCHIALEREGRGWGGGGGGGGHDSYSPPCIYCAQLMWQENDTKSVG